MDLRHNHSAGKRAEDVPIHFIYVADVGNEVQLLDFV